MKAMVYRQYGPPGVLQLEEVNKPVPKDNEVVVKIKATAVNSGDVRLRKADPFAMRFFFGLTKPKRNILGGVLSGEIESVGASVRMFKVADKVFGTTGMHFGAYAEYICLPENAVLALKPKDLKDEETAVIPFGGLTALFFIKKANIQKGQRVLINGASGAVGTAAIQLANYFGAHVTGVCSTTNVELVNWLGADAVIDYTKEDFTKNGETYDVIFDTVGKVSFSNSLRSLNKKGILILGSSGMSGMLLALWTSLTSSKKVIAGMIRETAVNLNFLKEIIDEHKYKAVIDRTYPFAQIAEAHAYVEMGHKKGNVAIIME